MHILEIITIFLLLLNIFIIASYPLSIILACTLLLLIIINLIFCTRDSRHLNSINKKIKEGTEKGLAHLIDLQFDTNKSGKNIADLAYNLNSLLQEIKKVFWDIKENLFATKISKNTLDNIQILMISYIQKVVNIGNVRTQMEGICKRINEATNSTKHILGSIIELANHTNKEAATIKQTSNALEQLLKTISDITSLTSDKKKMAEELKMIAKAGQEKVGKTAGIIDTINESTGEMLKIIEIINNIAESTNILSINAGIEAAHAGKEGKGFRVIADEIMKLVDSTKKNAGNISVLLKDQVNKMALALEESNGSGKALLEVNNEVQNAADTWIEISRKTIDMSRGTQVIQETMDNMFEITNAVSESSGAIKQSVEKINKEAFELDEATTRTLDILAKVTVTNEEAKKSTVTILQQLNEMTTFVNKLNKAIDFFNLGKRVFFLFSGRNTARYVKRILRNEYETYLTEEYKMLLKILKEYPNSIVLIDKDHAPGNFLLKNYIESIKKLPDARSISVGIISGETLKADKAEKEQCEYILCKSTSEEKNIEKICEFIEMKRAKGLRKYVRVTCTDKDNIRVRLTIHHTTCTGNIRDISSNALVAAFPKDTRLKSITKKFEFVIILKDMEYRINGKKGIIKSDNEYLIIFSDKLEEQVKNVIYEFIFFKLQEQLEMEMVKME